jgi:hypothetical protein
VTVGEIVAMVIEDAKTYLLVKTTVINVTTDPRIDEEANQRTK